MIRPVPMLVLSQAERTMNLTISQFTIEASLQSLYVRLGGREAWISREPGQPLRMFAKERHGGEMMVWGLGLHAVYSWA